MPTSNNTVSVAGQSNSNLQNLSSKAKISKYNKSPLEVNMSTLNDKLDQNLTQIAHCIDRIKTIDLALRDENNLLSSGEIKKLQKDKEKKVWARDGFGTQRTKLHREVEELKNTPGKNSKRRQKQKIRKLVGLKESKENKDIKDKGQKGDDQHSEGKGNDGGEEGQVEEVYETDETDSSVEFIICSPARFNFVVPAIPAKESEEATDPAGPAVAAKASETPRDVAGPEVTTKVSETPTDAAGPKVADNE